MRHELARVAAEIHDTERAIRAPRKALEEDASDEVAEESLAVALEELRQPAMVRSSYRCSKPARPAQAERTIALAGIA